MPSAHRLRGRLDEHAFDMAFQALIQRQPSMRTAFRDVGQDIAQVVSSQLEYPLFPAEDLSHLPAEEREARLMQRLQELTDTPFDLGSAPLFSAFRICWRAVATLRASARILVLCKEAGRSVPAKAASLVKLTPTFWSAMSTACWFQEPAEAPDS